MSFKKTKKRCSLLLILALVFTQNLSLLPMAQASTDAVIVINPAHGIYEASDWNYQRPWILLDDANEDVTITGNYEVFGYEGRWDTAFTMEGQNEAYPYVVEDLTTPYLSEKLYDYLNTSFGFSSVYSTRELDRDAGSRTVTVNGSSESIPLWVFSAKDYFEYEGYSSSIWDVANSGTNYDKDINSRWLYANSIGADAMLSLHTNASSWLPDYARGIKTYYSSESDGNESADAAASKELAEEVHNSIISYLELYYPGGEDEYGNKIWKDGGIHTGWYGEIGFFDGPGIIVEMGFHTNYYDASALLDATFRGAAALGYAHGAASYLGENVSPTLTYPEWGYTTSDDTVSLYWEGTPLASHYVVDFYIVPPDRTSTYSLSQVTTSQESYDFYLGDIEPDSYIYWSVQSVLGTGETSDFSDQYAIYVEEGTSWSDYADDFNREDSESDELSCDTDDPEVCGVDFSEATLAGIEIDPDTNALKFIVNAKEADEDDTVIDLSQNIIDMEEIFFQALTIPNDKLWISLDLLIDDDGNYYGQSRTEEPFNETDIADYFFDADVEMKFDLFTDPILGSEKDEGAFADWVSLVQASDSWDELEEMDFNENPYWVLRGAIIPDDISASEEDGVIFIEESKLQLEREIMNLGLDLSDYSVSEDLQSELDLLLDDFEILLQARLDQGADEIEELMNGDDPAYADIRIIYPIVAAAQWYKEAEINNKPYEEWIDTEDFETFMLTDSPFGDRDWDDEAYQDLEHENFFTALDGSEYVTSAWGGVLFEDLDLSEIEDIDSSTQEDLTSIEEDGFIANEGGYFIYGSELPANYSDLKPTGLNGESEKIIVDQSENLSFHIYNNSPHASEESTVSIYELTSIEDEESLALLSSETLSVIAEYSTSEISLEWTPSQIGVHSFRVIIDEGEELNELNKDNNEVDFELEVYIDSPTVSINWPVDGLTTYSENIELEGFAVDASDSYLDPEELTWTSDIDGELGEGTDLTVDELSEGTHVITLSAQNSLGNSSETSITLYSVSTEKPTISIISPSESEVYSSQNEIEFEATIDDYIDGDICSAITDADENVYWESSIDGVLAYSCSFNTELSLGTHTLTFSATNSSGNSSEESIELEVAEAEPTLSITSPADYSDYDETESITLIASATDNQDGDISADITWTSDLDGELGTGASLTQTLSPGTHTITALVIDSHGFSEEATLTLTIEHTPPTISITSPRADSEYDYETELTLTASASDTQDGTLTGDSIIWSSSVQGDLGTGESLAISSLYPGTHTLTATATDSDAQETSTSVSGIYIDAGEPAVTLSSPSDDDSFYYSQSITFTGSATDESDGTLTAGSLVWESSLDGSFGTGAIFTLDSLSSGAHTIRLTATDNDGWSTSESVSITVEEAQAPVLSLNSPQNNAEYFNGETLTLKAFANDAEDGDISANIIWESDLDGALGTGSEITEVELSEGTHTLTATIEDSHGAELAATRSVGVLNNAPEVSISNPEDASVFQEGDSIDLTAAASDYEDGALSGASITWSSSKDGSLGTGSTLTTDALSIGLHQITVTATDSDGEITENEVTLTIQGSSSILLSSFEDGSETLSLELTADAEESQYITLPHNANVQSAEVEITGYEGDGELIWTQETEGTLDGVDASIFVKGRGAARPAFSDINSDGSADLFIGDSEGYLWHYENDGADNFTYQTDSFEGITAYYNGSPFFFDLDQDGDEDLFLGEYYSDISYYTNDGNGEFTYETDSLLGTSVIYSAPAFLDEDGDGDYDLIVGSNSGELYHFENDGSENFTYVTASFQSIDVGNYSTPAFFDEDGDGDEDLFIGSNSGEIAHYENDGSNTFTLISSTYESIDVGGWSAPHFFDEDDDGDEDLFIGSYAGELWHYENDGSSNFTYITDVYEPIRSIDGENYSTPAFHDLDGDGDEDLFIGGHSGAISHYENDGSGAFTYITDSFESIIAGEYSNPYFADYDGDGDEDLFIGGNTGVLYLYENDGSGNFTYITDSFESIDVGSFSSPTFWDEDDDGDEDLFIGESGGAMWQYENDGSGNFSYITDSFESIDVGSYADPNFIDLDGDGDEDLLIAELNGEVWQYENDGSGNFTLITDSFGSFDLHYQPNSTLLDYDGDGDLDFFSGEYFGGLLLYLNEGYGVPENPSLDVTSNGTNDWSYSGDFSSSEVTGDFSASLNTYLAQDAADLTFDDDGNVLVPLTLLSESDGTLELSNLSVQYEVYDLQAPTIDSSELTPNPALSTESPTIEVTASDNVGVETVTFTVEEDSSIYTLVDHNDGTFSTSLNLSNLGLDAAGTYDIHLTATDESELTTTETLELTVIEAGADIALQDIAIEDDFSELTATFLNLGNTDQTGVNYTLYLASTELDSGSFDLTAGESTAWSLSSPFNEEDHQPGTQTLTLILDEDDDLSETDEDNNILTLDIWIEDTEAPVLESITLEENPVTQDEQAVFYVTATDNLEIDSVIVSWQDEEETLTYDETNEYYTGSITAAETGTTSATVTVTDTQGLTAQGSIDVEVLELSPDLSINDFSIEVDGSTITLSLLNEGPQSATDVDVDFEIDGTPQETQSFSLDAFAETDLTFDWSPSSADLTFTVDPDDTITELDETNNEAEMTVSLPPSAPPTIESFTLSPDPATESADITIEVELSVDGGDATGDEYLFIEWTTSGDTELLTYDEDSGLFTATTSTENTGDQELTLIAARSQSAYEASEPIYSQQAETIEVLADAAELEVTDLAAILWTDADEDGLNDNTEETSLLEAGETYELLLTVENSGSQDASTNTLNFSLNSSSEDSQTLTLTANTSDEVSFTWTPELGAHSLEFTIDSDSEITERDETNNTLTQSLTAYDFTAPSITEITWDETIYEGMSMSFTIEGEDNEEIAGASITLDGTTTDLTLSSSEYVDDEDDDGNTITNHSATYEGTVTAPTEGDETLTFTLTDSSGLTATTSRAIEVHSLDPDFTVDDFSLDYEAPLEEDLGTEFSVDVTNQGGSDSSVTVELQIDGTSVDSSTQTIAKGETQTLTFAYTGVFGDHELSIIADPSNTVTEGDETNNEITRDIYVFDALAPEAPTLTVSPSDWTDDPDYTLSWTTVSDNRGIDYYEYRINQGEWTDNGSSTTASLTADEDGIHVIEVRAVDNAANEGDTETGYFYLDTTVPETPILLGPANPDNASKDTTPYFYWNNPGDHGSGVQEYEVFTSYFSAEDKEASETDETITPTETTSNTSDESHEPTLTADGFYTLKIRAIDALENNSDWSNEITIQLDTTAPSTPEITSTTHTESTWSLSKTPEFAWDEPTDDTSISGYYYIFDQETDTEVTSSGLWTDDISISMSALPVMTEEPVDIPDGTWYFHLVAKDELGHISETDTYEILIDTTAPYTELELPEDMESAPFTIDFDVFEAASGLDFTTYKLNDGAYSEGDSFTLTEDDERDEDADYDYTLYYYSTDLLGNEEEEKSYSFDVEEIIYDVDLYIENTSITEEDEMLLEFTLGNLGLELVDSESEGHIEILVGETTIMDLDWSDISEKSVKFLDAESSLTQRWNLYESAHMATLTSGETYAINMCIDSTELVDEDDEENNCEEIDWEFNGDLPDQYVEITAQDLTDYTFDYTIGNQGAIDVSGGRKGVNIFYLDEEIIDVKPWDFDDDKNDYTQPETSLDTSYTIDFTRLDTEYAEGYYDFKICVDAEDRVKADSDTSNDCAVEEFYLEAVGIDLTTEDAAFDETTQLFTYTNKNQGELNESASTGGENSIYIDDTEVSNESWSEDSIFTFAYLSSDNYAGRNWYAYEVAEWSDYTAGDTLTFMACMDSSEVSDEIDEDNNCDSTSFEFDGNRPDLTTTITDDASSFAVDYILDYKLTNEGEINVHRNLDGIVSITLDGVELSSAEWKDEPAASIYLSAGALTNETYTLDTTALSSGTTYELEVCIDADDDIPGEHDNTNNCDSLSFTY
jgi:hypothetical protein